MNRPYKIAPGPKGLPFVGNVLEAQKDFIGFCRKLALEYGEIASFKLGSDPALLISHPDYIQEVLQNKQGNYGRSPFHKTMAMILGEGLLTGEGKVWQEDRKTIVPLFHKRKIQGMAEQMSRRVEQRFAIWDGLAERGKPFDMSEEMDDLTLEIILETMFGSSVSREESYKISTTLRNISEFSMQRTNQPVNIPTWVPIPQNFKFKRTLRLIDEVFLKIIKDRRNSNVQHMDLLSMLMEATTADGRTVTEEHLRDQMATFIFAGHETTATHLSWTWLLLAENPRVLEKLQDEAQRVLDGRVATAADMPNLPYTQLVLQESLRYYPVIWTYGRMAKCDHELGGFSVPDKSLVFVPIHTMHHHPKYWDQPEEFRPERFENPELKTGKYKYIYFPFGIGPRICIGNHFAIMESVVTLASLVQRYTPELVPNQSIQAEPLMTLRSKKGIQMKISTTGVTG